MNVVLYGATGMIGSRILRELVSRGHRVTAVARNISKVPTMPGVEAEQGDVRDPESVAMTAEESDAAISAISPGLNASQDVLSQDYRSLIAGLKKAGVKRLIAVGGAGSLEVVPGVQLVDTPDFPAGWKGVALAHRDVLKVLGESGLDWTSLSPAALIQPGTRTGKFRIGKDQLLTDSKGESRISAEDYAVALVDELENPKHVGQRFTVAY
ncbi:MAG TPA: NAD(P)-dependent oxidoreductase [Acidisarcina sp.]|nr:NAD(P)-dependent oxidoreductase [Acidisarcina sp.]